MADEETIVCENCQRAIAAANHTVHVSHCRRHLSVCVDCGEAVPRSQLDQHRDDEHRPLPCHLCGLHVPSGQMDTHKEERCSGRPVTCPYCDLSMPSSSLEEHESYCGSRTELCPTCNVRVMYRHWPLHVKSGHKLTKPETASPPKAGSGKRGAAYVENALANTLEDDGALDEKIASYVRKPVEEIVEDTMEQWRKRKDLRKFEDDCFEQAMLMAIELSKASATESTTEPCRLCGLNFPPDQLPQHQGSCSREQRRQADRQGSARRPSVGRRGGASPPRWVARPVAADQPEEDAITLPCEFCEQAFLDNDLLRHQLRCEKNPQRLDLPVSRAPSSRGGGDLGRSGSDLTAGRAAPPRPSLEPDGVSRGRSSWHEQHRPGLSARGPPSAEAPTKGSWRDRLSSQLDGSPLRGLSEAERQTEGRTGWRDRLAAETADESVSRRWSLLDMDEAPPKTPHRKSKHKKKVNFLGHDEFIHPEPEYHGEVVEGEKKKKKSKEEKRQKEEKKQKKRSSKKHRAPEPPGEPVISCEY